MRILHVITTLDIGGAERLMVDLLPRLAGEGNEVDLLLFNGQGSSFKDEIAAKGINVLELSCVQGYPDHHEVYNPMNIFRLMKHLGHYDIIHTHNTACQFYVPFARMFTGSKAKLVTTEHNTTNRRRDIAWFKPIDKWMYNQYAAIVCVSDQTEQNLKQYLGEDRYICTILNGVNVERFMMPVKDTAGKDSFTITMVAAFREQKDHPTLLRAMALLPGNYRLQLVGDGETAPKLRALCQELNLNDRVTFMGFRSDVQDILMDADVVVLSSHWEGLSLSSIEGMASGRPFVATDVDGLRDIVGGAGVLVPPDDEKALARSIQELCENPEHYKSAATACQERAMKYDIGAMAEGYKQLYRTIASGGK